MEVFPVLLQELTDESLDTAASKKLLSHANVGKQDNPKVESIRRGLIAGSSVSSDTEKLAETAKEFEAVFTAQLLSMMRDTANQTDFLGANSTSMKIFNSMLDEQYALRMAESGQLGLADMVIRQLSQYIDTVEDSAEGTNASLDGVGQQATTNLEEVLEAVVAGLTRDGLENAPDIDLKSLVASSQIIPDGELEPVSISGTSVASETEIDIEAADVVRFENVVVSTEANLDNLPEDETAVSPVDYDSGLFAAVDMDQPRTEVVESSSEGLAMPMDAKGVEVEITSVEEEIAAVELNQDFSAPENTPPDVELSQQNVENVLVSRQQTVDMEQTNSRQFHVVQAPSTDADSSDNGESDLLRRARSRASLIGSVRDFLIAQPKAEDGGRTALVELLANVGDGNQTNFALLQRLRTALMQLDSNQSSNGQQQQQLDSQKIQLPSELVANAPSTVTNSVQNLTLSWNQIQNLDANQLAALMNSAEGLNNAATLQLANADRVMIQIIDKISPQLSRGMQEAVIDLEPPRLGRLHIRLLFEDSSLNARIHVRNAMVAEVVRGNLAQLRSALTDQGIQIDNFQVTTGSGDSQHGDSSHQSNQFNGWQENMGYRQDGWNGSNRDMDQMSQAIRQTMTGSQSSEERQSVSDRSYSFDHLV
ncbi:TPA: hypothetical protein EYN98_32740 [Candidatus Poribacteria bacterium]|jgi:Rod binding domain-containing protein|nr:hypothetical protein [Candidatus Poribacteria bacterium]HIA70735.1 hypothetical protein [Candidatus Poribacteria bacterium]HIB86515.1 hypothetical protein [Candidatus Poribacteria bacterium]